ncbi:MAG TPA: phage tail tape measure protein [Anaerolineales bacterium]|nr:phage tail tape measure protein [Anaerolineales bacterium]
MSAQIAELFARIGADLTGLEKGLGQAENMLTGAGKKMSSLGSDLTRNLTVPLLAVGGAAAKAAIDLDEQMRNIQSISQQTDQEIGQLSDTFVDMSTDLTKTTDSARNLAAGFYQIQSSGFAGAEAMEVLEKATKAGTAGLSDTATAATGIAATLNAYGLGAEYAGHVSDLLFETVNRGVVTFGELTGSLSNVVGVAAQAGISFETVSAAIATMTKQGQSGAEATVALNQLILGIIKPSEDLAAVMQNLGYASGQAMLDTLGLQGTLQALADAGYSSTEAMASLFPNVRALRGALALTGEGAQMFVEDMQAMENAAGATDAAFEQQTKSMSAQLKNLRNELTALGMDLAQQAIPALQDGVTWLKAQAEAWRGLEPEVQKNIVVMAGIAVAIGPALKIIGGLVTAVGTLAGWFKVLAPAVGTAVTAFGAFIPQLVAAFQLMAGGEGVFAVATAGLAGFAAAALPVVAALAAIGVAYKKFISDTQKAGLESTGTAWAKFFEDVRAKGMSATQVANEYAKAQTRVNEQLAAANPLARAFVDEQEILRQGQVEAAAAILDAATRYNEYYLAMKNAGMAAQALSIEQFNLQKGITDTGPVVDESAQFYEQMAMRQQQAANASSQLGTAVEKTALELRGMHTEIIKFEDGSEKTITLFGSVAEAVGVFGDKAYYARDQVSRLMAQINAPSSGHGEGAFSQLVQKWGLDLAQLMSNAKSALQDLQNLLQFLEDNPQVLNALGQRPFLPSMEPPGGTTTAPGTGGTGGGGGNTGDGFGTGDESSNGGWQVAGPGGDTFNIQVNNAQAAALVMAEVDLRRRQRLARAVGG